MSLLANHLAQLPMERHVCFPLPTPMMARLIPTTNVPKQIHQASFGVALLLPHLVGVIALLVVQQAAMLCKYYPYSVVQSSYLLRFILVQTTLAMASTAIRPITTNFVSGMVETVVLLLSMINGAKTILTVNACNQIQFPIVSNLYKMPQK